MTINYTGETEYEEHKTKDFIIIFIGGYIINYYVRCV